MPEPWVIRSVIVLTVLFVVVALLMWAAMREES